MSSPAEPAAGTDRGWSLQAALLTSQLGLLLVVLLGFGGLLYWQMHRGAYQQAEADLLAVARLLVRDVEAAQGTPPENGKQELVAAESGLTDKALRNLAIPDAYRQRFGPAPRDHAYFAIWDATGVQIGGDRPLPPHSEPMSEPPPTTGRHPYAIRTHGSHLEVMVAGPSATQVLVGRPLAREWDGLYRLLFGLLGTGLATLAVGAVAAWALARWIAAPLERLAVAANRISARRLDRHVEPGRSSREVRQLATVLNRMLDSLGAAFQRQLRLTADASHELRTPVTVVLSQAEQTLFRDRSPEEYRAALETCLRSARRMKRLIDDLLLLARADSGRLELQLQRIDLAEVARQAVAMLEPIAAQHEIRLSSQLQSTMLRGDSLRLGQVAANLVNNAIVYNRPGGTVFVSVSLRADSAVLTVSDTGIGIAAEDRERMFERFYRADPARTHEPSQGAGLGLSIVQEIVAAHSGVLEVTSEAGAGTTMAVVLPTAGPGETGPRGSELIHE